MLAASQAADEPSTSADEPCSSSSTACRTRLNLPHRCVAAPMVGCSDLAFRLLVRRYGVDLTYTEMYHADRFVADAEYRHAVFESQLSPDDRPLVVQLGGNDVQTLVAAALLAQPHCDAVDLNLGCPQKRAREALCVPPQPA